MLWTVWSSQGCPVALVAGIDIGRGSVTGVVVVELDANQIKQHALLQA